ncbi:MAG: ribosome maturation factor RimP [candidate division KSB1 bacterium]|nr:ribosome maturation factor RimP [candidate division KSB1 bacterium]
MITKEKISALIAPIIAAHQVDLVDIELKGKPGQLVLRVYVDIVGGIGLDQCAAISRELSDVLDIADLIPGKYRLEVSSPGLDRPLKNARDFERNIGRQVRIKYRGQGDTVTSISGTIKAVTENQLLLEVNEQPQPIALSTIVLAKIQTVW